MLTSYVISTVIKNGEINIITVLLTALQTLMKFHFSTGDQFLF